MKAEKTRGIFYGKNPISDRIIKLIKSDELIIGNVLTSQTFPEVFCVELFSLINRTPVPCSHSGLSLKCSMLCCSVWKLNFLYLFLINLLKISPCSNLFSQQIFSDLVCLYFMFSLMNCSRVTCSHSEPCLFSLFRVRTSRSMGCPNPRRPCWPV